MKSRLDIGDHSSVWGQIWRPLAFLSALGLGIFLGWWWFLKPASSPIIPPSAAAVFPTTPATATVPVMVTGVAPQALGSGVRVGAPAPDFTLTARDGRSVKLSDYSGQVVVLNFWATWCSPCRLEMPMLQQRYAELAGQGLVVLGINWTKVDDTQQVPAYADNLGLTFPVLLDPQGMVANGLYPLTGLPTSVLIDRQGIVRLISVGPLSADNLQAQLDGLLGEPAGG